MTFSTYCIIKHFFEIILRESKRSAMHFSAVGKTGLKKLLENVSLFSRILVAKKKKRPQMTEIVSIHRNANCVYGLITSTEKLQAILGVLTRFAGGQRAFSPAQISSDVSHVPPQPTTHLAPAHCIKKYGTTNKK